MIVKSMEKALDLIKEEKREKAYFCKDERVDELKKKGYKVAIHKATAKSKGSAIKVVTTGDTLNLMIK